MEIVRRIGQLPDEELNRLRSVEVALDQCGDLLRGSAGEAAGGSAARPRPPTRRSVGSAGQTV